jgi:hypothetical protein
MFEGAITAFLDELAVPLEEGGHADRLMGTFAKPWRQGMRCRDRREEEAATASRRSPGGGSAALLCGWH